jgi:uncharacterized protein
LRGSRVRYWLGAGMKSAWKVLVWAWLGVVWAGGEESGRLKALLVTGGCCHDYPNQVRILTEGISERVPVQFDFVLQGGATRDTAINLFKTPRWAEGYDVVVHNLCFGEVRDEEFIESIARVHHEGVPAVVIHCSMHSFRHSVTDEWRQLVGVTSRRHERHRPLEVKNLLPSHPVMREFPVSWRTPNGELYIIERLWPDAVPLAQAYGEDTGQDHVCVWVNRYGRGRVFGTTLGHHNETMGHPVYLDLVSRGLMWAVGRLE